MILNKKIILIVLLSFFIIAGFLFLISKNLSNDNDSKINVVENVIYVGKEKTQSPIVSVVKEEKNPEVNSSKIRVWLSDFISKNIEQQKPKEINVPDDYLTIQEAIDAARFGDTVKVAAGEYKENIVIKQGVSLIGTKKLICIDDKLDFDFECSEEEISAGGFVLEQDNGTYKVYNINEDTDNEKEIIAEATVIENKNKEETNELVKINQEAPDKIREKVLMTIINGDGTGNVVTSKNDQIGKNKISELVIKNSGKRLNGIFINNASPLIHDNIIVDNEFGIYVKGESYPLIQKNVIQFSSKGIQINNFEELEDLTDDNSVDNNKKDNSSQAYMADDIAIESELSTEILASDRKVVITDNLITDNKVGIDIINSSAVINHNTISYNNHYKTYLGATYGINIINSRAIVSNNIITDSGVCELCAGVHVDEKSSGVVLKYNDIWNNKNDYVCYGECVLEKNNISEDPFFLDLIEGDYRLSEDSGLIGKSEDKIDLGLRW